MGLGLGLGLGLWLGLGLGLGYGYGLGLRALYLPSTATCVPPTDGPPLGSSTVVVW